MRKNLRALMAALALSGIFMACNQQELDELKIEGIETIESEQNGDSNSGGPSGGSDKGSNGGD